MFRLYTNGLKCRVLRTLVICISRQTALVTKDTQPTPQTAAVLFDQKRLSFSVCDESVQKMNVLITGTPGTGKTTLCQHIVAHFEARALNDNVQNETPFNVTHLNISDIVKKHSLDDGYDARFDTLLLDEDRLLDWMEETHAFRSDGVRKLNCVHLVDFHSCEIFPESWIDAVFVLQTDNTTLYDRLQARNYSATKIAENVECEIMQVVHEAAFESYKREIVHVFQNATAQDLELNVAKIVAQIDAFMRITSVPKKLTSEA